MLSDFVETVSTIEFIQGHLTNNPLQPRACQNGIQIVDYMLSDDAECYLDGANAMEPKPRACGKTHNIRVYSLVHILMLSIVETVEVHTGLAVVIALSVVIIFLALVAAVFIIYRKKRHFEQEYQRLANNKVESDDIEL